MKTLVGLLGLAAIALLSVGSAIAQKREGERPFVPVFEQDFADPFVLVQPGEFLAYATNALDDAANLPMARSTNLVDWDMLRDGERLHDAMPTLPVWARRGLTWAPEVIAVDGGFAVHFTARDTSSDLQCLGAAFSTSPRGPFTSAATAPLVCQTEAGGTIDSHPFRDSDGALYLYYKNDGNNPKFRLPTTIYAQRLSADGQSVEGPAVPLLTNDTAWEAHVIEAPTMVKRGTRYVMFYSANHFGWENHQRLSPYAFGYATCESPLGPCVDGPTNPIIHSYNDRRAGCLSGPGHQSVFSVGNRQFVSFHAWAATRGCRKFANRRHLYIAPLLWDGDVPRLANGLRRKAQ
jgi:beta-xylosidase